MTGPEQAPVFYRAYSQGYRGIRLDQLLGAGGGHDRTGSVAAQNDVVNVRAQRLVPLILALLPPDDALARILSAWSFAYELDSAAPTVFEAFMALWQRTTVAVHVPERLHELVAQQTGLGAALLADPGRPFFPAGTEATARDVAARTLEVLHARLGDNVAGWAWGRMHLAHWKHPLSAAGREAEFDIGPAPVSGGSHTLRNTGGELPPHAAASGAEYRIVVDFSEPDRFLAVQNIGNSGVPGHRHYRDQFEPWLRGEYHVVQLDPAKVEAESVTVLAPAG